MTSKLPPPKGSRILIGYRRGVIVLATIMFALDCATIGLFESKIKPQLFYYGGLYRDDVSYALLFIADLFTIVLFAFLAFRPQGFALLKNLSSHILTGCRVVFSLGLTVIILYEPAVELDSLMVFRSFIQDKLSDPAIVQKVFMKFFLCKPKDTLEVLNPEMAQAFQQHCQVARSRWFLGFFLAALVFGELALSCWTRDFEVQRERDGKLQDETREYKTMSEIEA
ncbi:hypothetical protein BGZ68_004877 [Mortierella alpina]|nr:hypothetical protein BGZ68_004877 [Mortierella alpina]